MGKLLSALLRLQKVERELAEVRSRLRVRQNAVTSQQKKIDQLRGDWQTKHVQSLQRRKDADGLELELKQREERVVSLRGALNSAKTNKEYATILTEINTIKADNSKLEDRVLAVMQEVEAIKGEGEGIQQHIEAEEKRLAEITENNQAEIDRLNGLLEQLSAKHSEAAAEVPSAELALFGRITGKVGGEAMAAIEVHGKKPPYDYICGGCFMGLNAEHANALRSRDEIRTCDNCGRILYMEDDPAGRPAQEQQQRS